MSSSTSSQIPSRESQTSNSASPESTDCPICGEVYGTGEEPESPCILYCGHIFGKTCIWRWLQNAPNTNCPTCRKAQIHPGCACGIYPSPLNQHPPIASNPADRVIPSVCANCLFSSPLICRHCLENIHSPRRLVEVLESDPRYVEMVMRNPKEAREIMQKVAVAHRRYEPWEDPETLHSDEAIQRWAEALRNPGMHIHIVAGRYAPPEDDQEILQRLREQFVVDFDDAIERWADRVKRESWFSEEI